MFFAFRALARARPSLAHSPLSTLALRTAPRLATPALVPPRVRTTLTPTHALPRLFHTTPPAQVTLNQAVRRNHQRKKKRPRSPLLGGNTHKKGVVATVFIAKPKKPNSAKRKVARVKLTNGKTVQAYVPGEGHTLQDHAVVLVRGGRAQDLPGVRCVKVAASAMNMG
ncbi:hypothetical protein EIP86_008610 [Pleurotus ostreatoroseus]|nr:hypothetical protein EIP86_008610 [Pleurotus ostreatoroseus]